MESPGYIHSGGTSGGVVVDVGQPSRDGQPVSDLMRASLVARALENGAAGRSDVAGCLIHSDRGAQTTYMWPHPKTYGTLGPR